MKEDARYWGKYRLIKRISLSGMSELFLGEQEGLGMPFVLKRLLPHLEDEPGMQESLIQEAKLLSMMDDVQLPEFYELFWLRGSPVLVMGHLNGKSLHEAMGRRPFPAVWVMALGFQAARVLRVVHEWKDERQRPLKIVHADVSPQNWICLPDGRLVLVDFGLAQWLGHNRELSSLGQRGKRAYRSPEQEKGLPLGVESDLYSLGLILWEALSGLCWRDLEKGDAALGASSDALFPGPLRGIIESLLQEAKEARYQRASDLEVRFMRLLGADDLFQAEELSREILRRFYSEAFQGTPKSPS